MTDLQQLRLVSYAIMHLVQGKILLITSASANLAPMDGVLVVRKDDRPWCGRLRSSSARF